MTAAYFSGSLPLPQKFSAVSGKGGTVCGAEREISGVFAAIFAPKKEKRAFFFRGLQIR